MTRQEYIKRYDAMAEKNYAEHVVKKHTESKIVLQKSGSSIYYTELIFVNRGLLVMGDIETSLFRYYCGDDLIGALHWIARSGYGYLAEKFTIGMNDNAKLRRDYDDDVARAELLEMRQAYDKMYPAETADPERLEVYEEAHEALEEYGAQHAEIILQRDLDFELTLGRVPAIRLIYAKAACKRALQLIALGAHMPNRPKQPPANLAALAAREAGTPVGTTPRSLKLLQRKHHEWTERNFPNPDKQEAMWRALAGMMEELGELSHALLKREQGIRVASGSHDAEARDAIGDLIAYTLHLCSNEGWDFEDIVFEVLSEVHERDWVTYPNDGRTE